jgi:hypothetical protein
MAETASHQPARMGRSRRMAKKMKVLRPPPTFHLSQKGTPNRRENRILLLKESEPGPSAGRGAFLMEGY